MEFRELLNTPGPVLLDGGMGTMLQARGLSMGEWPELVALEHPDWLEDIHRAYVEAGAQILCANTFGANREKLGRTGGGGPSLSGDRPPGGQGEGLSGPGRGAHRPAAGAHWHPPL